MNSMLLKALIEMRKLFLLLVSLVMFASACGSSSTLKGISKLGNISTASESMTEVTSVSASNSFSLKAQPKKLLIFYMGYTNCPDLCPTTLSDLRTARQSIGASKAANVSMAFATVDQSNDTPAVLLDYTKRFSFQPQDHALRPTSSELTAVQKSVFATSQVAIPNSDNRNTVNHTAYTYVINSAGQVVDEWDYGTPAKDMAHDMKVLLAKAV